MEATSATATAETETLPPIDLSEPERPALVVNHRRQRAPQAPDGAGICAVLVVEKCKLKQIKVSGQSGTRYTFNWSDKWQRLVREYTSVAEFQREEADIRASKKNLHAITTRLGEAHPVAHAEEALEQLICSGLKVPLEVRQQALERIALRAAQARDALLQPPRNEPEPQNSEPPPESPAPEVVALPEARWADEGGVPLDDPTKPKVTPVETTASGPVLTAPPQAQVQAGNLTHADLMQMPWETCKTLGKEKGVPTKNLSRDKWAEAYLEAQAAGFPNAGGGQ